MKVRKLSLMVLLISLLLFTSCKGKESRAVYVSYGGTSFAVVEDGSVLHVLRFPSSFASSSLPTLLGIEGNVVEHDSVDLERLETMLSALERNISSDDKVSALFSARRPLDKSRFPVTFDELTASGVWQRAMHAKKWEYYEIESLFDGVTMPEGQQMADYLSRWFAGAERAARRS